MNYNFLFESSSTTDESRAEHSENDSHDSTNGELDLVPFSALLLQGNRISPFHYSHETASSLLPPDGVQIPALTSVSPIASQSIASTRELQSLLTGSSSSPEVIDIDETGDTNRTNAGRDTTTGPHALPPHHSLEDDSSDIPSSPEKRRSFSSVRRRNKSDIEDIEEEESSDSDSREWRSEKRPSIVSSSKPRRSNSIVDIIDIDELGSEPSRTQRDTVQGITSRSVPSTTAPTTVSSIPGPIDPSVPIYTHNPPRTLEISTELWKTLSMIGLR
ncbi:hypothetical protein ADUPG1_013057 [Aduncisulcus paluster]|uniref:Uncharacterized protein n=1 Tax=Aduncisulcus paluster TaxID=2918883 RepID=A0ABQ5K5T3_9EUKA|nr:hypothetical protein ADUPG1_013057 [Aduncisulcus paluster]|eukprot:gnl/Carplike_NY0171/6932_a9559_255.p1 GENE.gnl/Carplike_NY0171/6932_a9559_255~~gnl/Carplike_NY0171/6932_a9559_255.p1  ORF type:complete len:274 (+),score=54.62 gnl/Carplike_NY0171/6932_a9559_255:51-872(+)